MKCVRSKIQTTGLKFIGTFQRVSWINAILEGSEYGSQLSTSVSNKVFLLQQKRSQVANLDAPTHKKCLPTSNLLFPKTKIALFCRL